MSDEQREPKAEHNRAFGAGGGHDSRMFTAGAEKVRVPYQESYNYSDDPVRLNAKQILYNRAQQLRQEASRLEAIANWMPNVIPVDVDAALVNLVLYIKP